ncbi:MAG: amidophosphoribosyltransferase [Paludibacteraceae bacterium]|nr:amidophosphoribosyltransferase [Paludibacteraceae bacterium]MBN2787861.1 amidophosphoribosyltransferase [Paludibacteraceae bacterium]
MCGIAMVRLLKPLEYYQVKYGTWQYGFQKLYLLMEKQHNRGQEGAGIASVKLNVEPGKEYISRERALGADAIDQLFSKVNSTYSKYNENLISDPNWAKENLPFAGEVYLGHLRYSTTGRDGISYVHPFLRRNNWKSNNLILAGNFNLTNVDEVFDKLVSQGQHPRDYGDTFIMLEQMGHFLEREVEHAYQEFGKTTEHLTEKIESSLNIGNIIRRSSASWDGGYTICGILGHGDSFVFRDPWGIRPAFYYADDEIVIAASERPVIQTTLNIPIESVHEINPGEALIIKKDGRIILEQIRRPEKVTPCSFERIYFSRGSDQDIYSERKKLGELLTPRILKSIDNDLDNTVFSFIPNTAEIAFYGMFKGLQNNMIEEKKKFIHDNKDSLSTDEIIRILNKRPRIEKVALKDIKLRTFIAQDSGRNDLAAHVYDVTYGSIVQGKDNLVVIDDSIVRGTTLKQSIIKILDRLGPKKIVIVSSSPQIRYPDCYGIDMSRMSEFIAFKATIELLNETGNKHIINEVYNKCKAQQALPKEQLVNYVREIYHPFTNEQISAKIAEMLTPKGIHAKVEIVFQDLESLHQACPNNTGDWYFSGNYPTAGGNRVVNNAYINYIEGKDIRSY